MTTFKEQHIAWLKEQIQHTRDLERIIVEESARFYSRHGDGPQVETTQQDLDEARRKRAEAERLLARWEEE